MDYCYYVITTIARHWKFKQPLNTQWKFTTQVNKRNTRVKYKTCLMSLRHQNNVIEVILVSLLLTLTRYHTMFSSVYFC